MSCLSLLSSMKAEPWGPIPKLHPKLCFQAYFVITDRYTDRHDQKLLPRLLTQEVVSLADYFHDLRL